MNFLPADYIRKYNIPKYPDAPKQFSFTPDDSCPFATDFSIQERNPDRGFRGELYLTLGRDEAYPLSGKPAIPFFKENYQKHREDQIQIYQLYVYLSEYYRVPIDEAALQQLHAYFLMLREKHIRVLLRFAYETESSKTCPSTRLMSENIRLLRNWMDRNNALVNAVVYAGQLGMIGYWGEGHSESRPCDKKRIVPEILRMFPPHLPVMVRTPQYLKYVPVNQLRRCSIHDDFLIGTEHPWGMIPYSHCQYPMLLNMTRHTLCDGEMPWGRDKTMEEIDPLHFIKQCADYGLCTLSAEHNYKEDGGSYHLAQWKNIYLSRQYLEENHLPVFSYAMTEQVISVFDYLKYHLGYLLAISNLSRDEQYLTFCLYNFGMGIPANFSIEYKKDGETICENLSSMTAFSVKTISISRGSVFRIFHNADPSVFITPMNDLAIDPSGYISLI